jgi:type II secretory pathway pseudopilin PulG
MRTKSDRGFALIEALIIIATLYVLAMIALPDIVQSRDKAREAETKANLHTIQVALERYATDHSKAYPNYIIGGDLHGWDERSGCRSLTYTNDENQRPSRDPLIQYAYLNSYPRNPFIKQGDGVNTIIFLTGASADLGDGDVRFGWDGECMGNCLDDPRFLFNGEYGGGFATRLKYTMLTIPSAYLGIINMNSPNTFYTMGGMPQWSNQGGAQSDTSAPQLNYWWPGEFFYRCGGDVFVANALNVTGSQYETIWGWPYMRVNKYMLGAYGSLRTDGMDVIRLTIKSGEAACVQSGATNGTIYGQYYQDNSDPDRKASHPNFDALVQYSNPEVFGGGERGLMPQFPYYDAATKHLLYGAPDGYPDGIVLVLTSQNED